jgi:RNA 2',3'-cyclic 3'-phosphodiesterase
MRLFTAIELPDRLKHRLAGVAPELIERRAGINTRSHGISFTREENLHVTLKFLGDVPERSVVELCAALESVPPAGMLTLQLTGLEFFPERGPIRIIAAKVGGDVDRLQRVYHGIEAACAALGFERERRRYRAHVTLARARGGFPGNLRGGDDSVIGRLVRNSDFQAGEFVLMESLLHPSGSQYRRIARIPIEPQP